MEEAIPLHLLLNGEEKMKRSLSDIIPIATSHKAGMKRVLLATNESECPITQIAITDLRAG